MMTKGAMQKLCRSDVEIVKASVKDEVRVPDWVEEQKHRLYWAKDAAGKHMQKTGASWDQMLHQEDDEDDDDEEPRRIVDEQQFFEDFETIRAKFAVAPAGYHPSRNTTIVNGRPVQILVLTHENETLSAKMPYMSAACGGCPIMLMWGRCARKAPECTPATSIWWWFMDRVAFTTTALSTTFGQIEGPVSKA
jgi:hypothetical protein